MSADAGTHVPERSITGRDGKLPLTKEATLLHPQTTRALVRRNDGSNGAWLDYLGDLPNLLPGQSRTGTYRGVDWRIERHPELGHLCGYLTTSGRQLQRINSHYLRVAAAHAHGGFTCRHQSGIGLGFDCAHVGFEFDFVPGCFLRHGGGGDAGLIYRDYNYVMRCITRMIDAIHDRQPRHRRRGGRRTTHQ